MDYEAAAILIQALMHEAVWGGCLQFAVIEEVILLDV
jgi:hypothetical protein